MIAVIVGYKLKTGADIQPIFMELRSHAITYHGFVQALNVITTRDKTIAAIIYSWEKIEDWHEWENSIIRQKILNKADNLLLEQPRTTVYRVMPTTAWSYNITDD